MEFSFYKFGTLSKCTNKMKDIQIKEKIMDKQNEYYLCNDQDALCQFALALYKMLLEQNKDCYRNSHQKHTQG